MPEAALHRDPARPRCPATAPGEERRSPRQGRSPARQRSGLVLRAHRVPKPSAVGQSVARGAAVPVGLAVTPAAAQRPVGSRALTGRAARRPGLRRGLPLAAGHRGPARSPRRRRRYRRAPPAERWASYRAYASSRPEALHEAASRRAAVARCRVRPVMSAPGMRPSAEGSPARERLRRPVPGGA